VLAVLVLAMVVTVVVLLVLLLLACLTTGVYIWRLIACFRVRRAHACMHACTLV
jgi:hypothetical protein